MLSGAAFAKEMVEQVQRFCDEHRSKLPAYSYVPCTTDAQRLKVMQSRFFNEIRAAEVLGTWLKGTPEREVKAALAEAIHEEFEHAELLEAVMQGYDVDPYTYQPLPAQVAMFNAFESLPQTVERMAAFPLAGEGVASFMMERALETPDVPEWIKGPYRRIIEDESEHGSFPAEVIARYADTTEKQDLVRRAVSMSLMLRRQYFANLDRWVFEDEFY
ncbi:MAG: ferritin-like domain-containing protein [Candidatus Tectomicrobia bacterium]